MIIILIGFMRNNNRVYVLFPESVYITFTKKKQLLINKYIFALCLYNYIFLLIFYFGVLKQVIANVSTHKIIFNFIIYLNIIKIMFNQQ